MKLIRLGVVMTGLRIIKCHADNLPSFLPVPSLCYETLFSVKFSLVSLEFLYSQGS